MANIPNRNLPPDASKWGRWVEEQIRQINSLVSKVDTNTISVQKQLSATGRGSASLHEAVDGLKNDVQQRYDHAQVDATEANLLIEETKIGLAQAQADLAIVGDDIDVISGELSTRLGTAEQEIAAAEGRLAETESDIFDAFGRIGVVETDVSEAIATASGKASVKAQATPPEPDGDTLWIDTSDGNKQKVWIDYGPGPRENLMRNPRMVLGGPINPSLATGVGGTATWDRVVDPDGVEFSRMAWTNETPATFQGGAGLNLSSSWPHTTHVVDMAATYSARARVRSASDRTLILYMQYLNDAGSNVGNRTKYATAVQPGEWFDIILDDAPPLAATEATRIRVLIYYGWQSAETGLAVGDYLDVQRVHLEKSASIPSYFDGDSPGAHWSGDPHASTSIYGGPAWVEVQDAGVQQAITDADAAVADALIAIGRAEDAEQAAITAETAADTSAQAALDALTQAQAAGGDATAAQAAATAAQTAADASAAAAGTAGTSAATADAAAAQAAADAAQAVADAAAAASSAGVSSDAAVAAQADADAAVAQAVAAAAAADLAETAASGAAGSASAAEIAADTAAGNAADALAQAQAAGGDATAAQAAADLAQAAADAAQVSAAAADTSAAQADADAAQAAADAAQAVADAAAALASAAAAEGKADDAIATAGVAMSTADGLTKIFHSASPPSAQQAAPDGSLWFQHETDIYGPVIGQWMRQGPDWHSTPITSEAIANLDVGKLTAGSAEIPVIVSEKIGAAVGSFIEVDVGNLIVTEGATIPTAVIETIWSETINTGTLTATEKILTPELAVDGFVTARMLNIVPDVGAGGMELVPEGISILTAAEDGGPASSAIQLRTDLEQTLGFIDAGEYTFSVSQAGDLVSKTASFNESLVYKGTELQEMLDKPARGIIEHTRNTSNAIVGTSDGRLLSATFRTPATNRKIKVTVRGHGGTGSPRAYYQLRQSEGASVTPTNSMAQSWYMPALSGGNSQSFEWSHIRSVSEFGWPYNETITLGLFVRSLDSGGTLNFTAANNQEMIVEDIGEPISAVVHTPWVPTSGGGGGGGNEVEPAKREYTAAFMSTWVQSFWQGGSAQYPYNPQAQQRGYTGYWASSNGVLSSMWGFDRSAIMNFCSGGDMVSATVTLENGHTGTSSSMVMQLGTARADSRPVSYTQRVNLGSPTFTRGQRREMGISSAGMAELKNGSSSAIAIHPVSWNTSTSNYGYFNQEARIIITVRK